MVPVFVKVDTEVWPSGGILDLLDLFFGIVFFLTAFFGFYKLYKVWYVDVSTTKNETDQPSIPAVAV